MPDERNLSAVVDQELKLVVDVTVPDDADVMVFQRITNTFMAQAIPYIQAKGIAVVVDFDDDLSRVHQANPAFKALQASNLQRGISDHSWKVAEGAADLATLVTVSTPALLKRYARRTPGVVIHNVVPDEFFNVKHHDSDEIGWGAQLSTHSNDAPMLGNSIDRLQRDGARFATIGDTTGIRSALHLRRDFHEYGPASLEDWPFILTQFGVGIAPLAETEFNRAKSWLKPLELSSVGVPPVMSPRAEYREIHRLGVGLLAGSPKEWYEILRRLSRDPIERQELGAKSREAVRHLTFGQQYEKWTDAWEQAYELQQES